MKREESGCQHPLMQQANIFGQKKIVLVLYQRLQRGGNSAGLQRTPQLEALTIFPRRRVSPSFSRVKEIPLRFKTPLQNHDMQAV